MEPAETGTYYFKKERIDRSRKNADDILVFYLTQYFKDRPGRRIDLADVTDSIDHGKGFSRATLVVIVRWKEDNEWNEKEGFFFVGRCKMQKGQHGGDR